jgi:diguanylate cyclase (GGDEF)-like protein/PAS domain S-box-containing protein
MKTKRESPKTEISPFQNKFLESARRYGDLLEHLPVGVYRTTPDGTIIEANQALARMLGYANKVQLKNINVKNLYVKREDRAEHLRKLDASETFFAEFELRCRDGKTIWGRDYPRAVIGAGGKIKYYDGILVDITQERQSEKGLASALKKLERSNRDKKVMIRQLESLSLTDDLTKLYNRRGFQTASRQCFELGLRNKKKMFLLFLDVDNLKGTNDTLGHKAGDAALVKLAEILTRTFRKSDVIGRMGGDEFAVFPIEISPQGQNTALDRLNVQIEEYNATHGSPFRLSISAGVACFDPESPCTMDELLLRADRLMYEQKRLKQQAGGKN